MRTSWTWEPRDTMDQPGAHKRMSLEARRISSQHRKLNMLHRVVVDAINRARPAECITAFKRFREALDSHFSLEDELYFPALHGLRRDLSATLERLSQEHAALRSRLAELEAAFVEARLDECARLLDTVGAAIADHESREEQVLRAFRDS